MASAEASNLSSVVMQLYANMAALKTDITVVKVATDYISVLDNEVKIMKATQEMMETNMTKMEEDLTQLSGRVNEIENVTTYCQEYDAKLDNVQTSMQTSFKEVAQKLETKFQNHLVDMLKALFDKDRLVDGLSCRLSSVENDLKKLTGTVAPLIVGDSGKILQQSPEPPFQENSKSKVEEQKMSGAENQPPSEQTGESGHQQVELSSQNSLTNVISDEISAQSCGANDVKEDTHQTNDDDDDDEKDPPKCSNDGKPKEEDESGSGPFSAQSGVDCDGTHSETSTDKKDVKDIIQYDRAFLLELCDCAYSRRKPLGLADVQVVLDNPITVTLTASGKTLMPSKHHKIKGKKKKRSGQNPDEPPDDVSEQDNFNVLHRSENPWRPTPVLLSSGQIFAKKKTLKSEVLFIMNRLTQTNFERLAGEMRKLDIKTYEDVQEVVQVFFDKVTTETKFVEAYAKLCKVMSGLKVPPPPDSGIKESQATFRVVMLTKCQQEFEAYKSIGLEDPEEKKRKIEAEMPEGPERAEKIKSALYQLKLKRQKFYGTNRFIGELFKLGMLTENIMHDSIYRLLKARDDDSLVSLCNLITTVGQALDTDKAKTSMDQYFQQINKLVGERTPKIKFLLMDLITLRANNWVPRKETTGPKKIDEVHKDFQQEQATKQFLQNQPPPPRNEPQQPGSRRGSRQRQEEKPTDDGWNTVGSKSIRIDASKMKLSKTVVDENSIQLGPGGGASKFSMWSRGSGAQAQEGDRPAPAANRFAALRGEEDKRNFQRSPSRGDNNAAYRGMRQGPTAGHGRGKVLSRLSNEGERRDALANARSIVGGRSQNSSRDNSWNREDRRPSFGPRGSREGENPMTRSDISLRPNTESLLPPSAQAPSIVGPAAGGYDGPMLKKLKPLSESEMEHKAKTILEEYLNIQDLEEAKLCMRELEGQKYMDVLVTACINDVLERDNKKRQLTGKFFHEMVKAGLLAPDAFNKGLSDVLQFAEDMVIDIPKMWNYLAQMIAPLLIGGSLPWSQLETLLKPNLEERCCAKLLVEILLIAKESTSEAEVARMWQTSGLQWSTFLPSEDVNNFLHDHKLEFVVAPVPAGAAAGAPVSATGMADLERVTNDIERLVAEKRNSSTIIDYIEKNVPVEKVEANFVRALMTAVTSASISSSLASGSKKANEEVIKSNKELLLKYMRGNTELELQALYAIQALMHKLEHPSGIIISLFETLIDEEIISEDAFKCWEKSTDPKEQEGKGPCSMQLTQFFTWLRENEEPEGSS